MSTQTQTGPAWRSVRQSRTNPVNIFACSCDQYDLDRDISSYSAIAIVATSSAKAYIVRIVVQVRFLAEENGQLDRHF